jgi:hypothetical protein
LPNNKESDNPEVISLCDEAIKKLDKVIQEERGEFKNVRLETSKKKKYIVINLAKKLEDKIPIDTICQTIVNHLNGLVSRRFIRNCLDKKYKQERHRKNAEQQKKNHRKKNKLAVLPPLNREEEKRGHYGWC